MKRIRILHLLLLIISFAILGYRFAYFAEELLADKLIQWLLTLMLVSLMLVDARIRGLHIVQSTHWLFIMTSQLSCSVYVLWSRGWRGLPLLIVLYLAFGAAEYGGYLLAVATR